jgi:hypothetical protein
MNPLDDQERREIEYLLANGRKVAAVKKMREATGADLTDAVKMVERIASTLSATQTHGQPPPVSSRPIEPGGCVGLLLLGTLALPVAAYLLTNLT